MKKHYNSPNVDILTVQKEFCDESPVSVPDDIKSFLENPDITLDGSKLGDEW